MRVTDDLQESTVYPANMLVALRYYAATASAHDWGIFKDKRYRGRYEGLGKVANQPAALPPCTGYLDSVRPVATDPNYIVVDGWLVLRSSGVAPNPVTFTDASGKIIGYALTGRTRADVAQANGFSTVRTGLKGYIQAGHAGETITLLGDNICRMTVTLPARGAGP
jgi:hypothetical protein